MTAAGLGLNKYCYAGLIAAHKNKVPHTDDTCNKVRGSFHNIRIKNEKNIMMCFDEIF